MREILKNLKKNKLAMVGLSIVLAFVIIAIFAPWISPHDPEETNLEENLEGPSSEHPFGTDELGRDIFSRILYGSRISLLIGFVVVIIAMAIGVPIGLISGYYGGKIDFLIQRMTDSMLAFPGILLALLLVSIFGINLLNIILAIGIAAVPIYIRLVRGVVLSVREEVFVEASEAMGFSDRRIIFRHILLNSLSPIIIQSSLYLGMAILWAAGLGFLGLGVPPPTPEWGAMLGAGREYIRAAPHVTIFPGLAIFFSVFGLNLLGDGLRDVLDPKFKDQVNWGR